MFIYKFNSFFAYQLKNIVGVTLLRQINMVGPYVTLFYTPILKQSFNENQLCFFSDLDHDDAHGANYLRIFFDKLFNHVHVILPGKESLDKELKDLLTCEKLIYHITESQINDCITQYKNHTKKYNPTEHKQAIHNLIKSIARYHYNTSNYCFINNHSDINVENSIISVKNALVQSMIEPKYEKMEKLRQVLQKNISLIPKSDKNYFIKSLLKIMPYSPSKNFNNLIKEKNLHGELNLIGLLLLMVPINLFMFMLGLLIINIEQFNKRTKKIILIATIDTHIIDQQNNLLSLIAICIGIFIFGYWMINAPEIYEALYNKLHYVLYNKNLYTDNIELQKLIVNYYNSTQGETGINDIDLEANNQETLFPHNSVIPQSQQSIFSTNLFKFYQEETIQIKEKSSNIKASYLQIT